MTTLSIGVYSVSPLLCHIGDGAVGEQTVDAVPERVELSRLCAMQAVLAEEDGAGFFALLVL